MPARLKVDEWFSAKEDEVQSEFDLDRIFPTEVDKKQTVVKQPVKGEVKLSGTGVFLADLKVGSISYFLHWSPPAILAQCATHDDCYCTAPLLGEARVPEDELIAWVGQGPSFRSAQDHAQFIPRGCYRKRQGRK